MCLRVDVDGDEYWIGLKKEGSWTWRDGETLIYTYWLSGEPNLSGPCVRLAENAEWRDQSCGLSYKWICKTQGNHIDNGFV